MVHRNFNFPFILLVFITGSQEKPNKLVLNSRVLKHKHKILHGNEKCSYLCFPVKSRNLANAELSSGLKKVRVFGTSLRHCIATPLFTSHVSTDLLKESCVSYKWNTLHRSVPLKCSSVAGSPVQNAVGTLLSL